MSDKNALHEKLKNMTSEEIFKHLRAAETANRLVSAAGITALFAMLVYPNAVTILFTTYQKLSKQ
jgi:hypothetical protein